MSGGDYQFSEDDSGLHTTALSAFKFVHRKVAAGGMSFDARQFYRLAASRAGIIHAKVKRHDASLCGLDGGSVRTRVELSAKIQEMLQPRCVAVTEVSVCQTRYVGTAIANYDDNRAIPAWVSHKSVALFGRDYAGRLYFRLPSGALCWRRNLSPYAVVS